MKIVILQGGCLPVPPHRGGAVEKMWHILGQKFAERGCDVVHISRRWGGMPTQETIRGVQHIRTGGYNMPKNMVASKVLDMVYTLRTTQVLPRDADVVVTNTFWAPILLPFFCRARVYVDVARMPKGQMRLYEHAARLRANSMPVADAIRAELPERLHYLVGMIPNPLPYESAAQVDFQEKDQIILYCGRLHPEKGLNLLARSAACLPSGWSLHIVGPWEISEGGGGESYLQSLKKSLTRAGVQFIDPIYDIERLNQLYRRASIFVYPSVAEKGETFGLAPLEAMAWGCVPVVSDLACFKDFITHDENGLIFNHRAPDASIQLSRCLQKLTEDDAFRSKLAERALAVRSSHSPDRIADIFLADFERILN